MSAVFVRLKNTFDFYLNLVQLGCEKSVVILRNRSSANRLERLRRMKSFHVIQNIPSPYRLHLFAEMHRQLTDAGVDFHVHFMSDMSRGHDERPLSWRNPKMSFPHTYWPDYGISHHHFNPSLICFLRKITPDFLLVGCPFDTFTSLFAAWLCPARVRCTWSEGNTKTPGTMTGFKGWLKRAVFSKYGLIAVPGHDAAKYIALHQTYTKRKMPDPVMLPNLIDETRFKPRSAWNMGEIEDVRTSLGVGVGERLALTPARLEPVKGLLEYISLLNPEMLSGWRVAILGQGPLKEDLFRLVRERGIGKHLVVKDFVPYSEMPKYYAAADVFVLPSRHDPNPLSVVEALHSGLPVAVSEMAGNVDEAVTEGKNGWILPVKDSLSFEQVLNRVFSSSTELLCEMGKYSCCENAQFWDTKRCVTNFLLSIGVSKEC